MTAADEEILAEEVVKKTKDQLSGPEIFAELKTLCPTIVEEDYRKGAMWTLEIMLLDAELLRRHRVDCGAQEVETKLPEYEPPSASTWANLAKPTLPSWAGKPATSTATISSNLAATWAKAQENAAAANLPKAQASGPVLNGGQAKPVGAASLTAGTTVAAGGSVTASAASDLRMIAVFVAQWKMDPTKTKLMLAKLTPARRRWVMAKFKNAEGNGAASTEKLEEFIKVAETSDLWENAEKEYPGAAPAAKAHAPAKAAGPVGVKRAAPATMTQPQAAKRPALAAGAAGGAQWSAAASQPAGMGMGNGMGMGMGGGVRPGMGMMGGMAQNLQNMQNMQNMMSQMNSMMGGMGGFGKGMGGKGW